MERITEEVLMKRAVSYLPKGIPARAIESVEICDDYDNRYIVYFRNGFRAESGYGGHLVIESTLTELKQQLKYITYCPTDLEEGFGKALDNFPTWLSILKEEKESLNLTDEDITNINTALKITLDYLSGDMSLWEALLEDKDSDYLEKMRERFSKTSDKIFIKKNNRRSNKDEQK